MKLKVNVEEVRRVFAANKVGEPMRAADVGADVGAPLPQNRPENRRPGGPSPKVTEPPQCPGCLQPFGPGHRSDCEPPSVELPPPPEGAVLALRELSHVRRTLAALVDTLDRLETSLKRTG